MGFTFFHAESMLVVPRAILSPYQRFRLSFPVMRQFSCQFPRLMKSDCKRPDGITLIPRRERKCLAWGVTVDDTFAPTYLSSTSVKAGSAAGHLAAEKRIKYADLPYPPYTGFEIFPTGGAPRVDLSDDVTDVTDDVVAPSSAETLAALITKPQKHPSARTSSKYPIGKPADSACLQVSAQDVLGAMRSFPARSSGGSEGIRPNHLNGL